jgi:predicted Zn-ribbon and HTH transcriptional regulator
MVTIATFDDAAKARHLKKRLQDAGVKADMHTERLQAVATLSDPHATTKILVEEEEFAKANQLLTEWEGTDEQIASAIRCPQCQSPRIQYPQLARRFPLVPGLAGILFALKIFEKEFYCEDCQFTWGKGGNPLPDKKEAWETFS